MVEGRGASSVRKAPGGEDLWAGGFPVPKSADEDRAITDMRRGNWAQTKKVPKVRLPCGADFEHGTLHPGKTLVHHIFDLPHFYHHLFTGGAYIRVSPLRPPLTRAEAEGIGLPFPKDLPLGEKIQPCLRVLAMGDHKAVGIAQNAHEAMLRAAGIEEGYMLKYGEPLPDNYFTSHQERPWVSVCIDDNVLQSEVGLKEAQTRDTSSSIERTAESVLAMYESVGLPPKESKVKRLVTDAKALGTEILEVRGWTSAPLVHLSQMMLQSTYLFGRPYLDRKTGEKLVG